MFWNQHLDCLLYVCHLLFQFSIVESVFVAIMDEFPSVLRKNKFRPILFRGVCIFCFFFICLAQVSEGGFYLFVIMDDGLSGFPLLFIGFFEVISLSWVYGESSIFYIIFVQI